jgi:hypothetical protein
MKKENMAAGICAAVLLWSMVISCRPPLSVSELSKQVQEEILVSMRERGYELRITQNLVLEKQGKTRYSGFFTTGEDPKPMTFRVKVEYDGKKFEWEMKEY